MPYSIAIGNINFVLRFKNSDWKKFMKEHFSLINPSTFELREKVQKQQKLKENLGKI